MRPGRAWMFALPVAACLLTLAIVEGICTALLRLDFARPGPSPEADRVESAYELRESLSGFPIVDSERPVVSVSPLYLWDERAEVHDGLWTPERGLSGAARFLHHETRQLGFERALSTDRHARRVPPWHEERKRAARWHVVGFGCSLTWGEAVNDDETFLAAMEKSGPGLITYNVAFGGYGPTENLMRATATDVLDDLEPKTGVGVYVVFVEHLMRMANSLDLVGSWRPWGVVFREDPPGRFEFLGTHEDLRPWRTFFARFWARSSFVKFFGLDVPPLSDRLADQFARMMLVLRERYRQKTRAENPFVVVIFPYGQPQAPLIRRALDRAHLPFLDYSRADLEKRLVGPDKVENEGHPSPEFQEKFGIALRRDLENAYPEVLGDSDRTPSDR